MVGETLDEVKNRLRSPSRKFRVASRQEAVLERCVHFKRKEQEPEVLFQSEAGPAGLGLAKALRRHVNSVPPRPACPTLRHTHPQTELFRKAARVGRERSVRTPPPYLECQIITPTLCLSCLRTKHGGNTPSMPHPSYLFYTE